MKNFKFSETSIERLLTCHPDLVMVINYALKSSPLDFSVLCGYRGEIDQYKAFSKGRSQLKYPQSKHNKTPSLAVDIVPYPAPKSGEWDSKENIERFTIIMRHVENVSKKLGVRITGGFDWGWDLGHFELKV